MSNEQMTIRLGDEFDEALRAAVRAALVALGALTGPDGGHSPGHFWGVAGSQEIETLEVTIDGERIVVEAETYMGLTITGGRDVVQRLANQVRAQLLA